MEVKLAKLKPVITNNTTYKESHPFFPPYLIMKGIRVKIPAPIIYEIPVKNISLKSNLLANLFSLYFYYYFHLHLHF